MIRLNLYWDSSILYLTFDLCNIHNYLSHCFKSMSYLIFYICTHQSKNYKIEEIKNIIKLVSSIYHCMTQLWILGNWIINELLSYAGSMKAKLYLLSNCLLVFIGFLMIARWCICRLFHCSKKLIYFLKICLTYVMNFNIKLFSFGKDNL